MLVIEIILMLASVLWIVMGVSEYGIWAGQAPGGGLFPLIAGSIILVCCALDIILRIKRKEPLNGEKDTSEDEYIMLGWVPRNLRPVAVAVYGFFSLVLLNYLGFIICAFFTCAIWLIFISRKKVLGSLIISVVVTAVLYSIFVLWLNIPFPKGLF